MARNSAIKVDNKFFKGLITEATDLNFPEDAVSETYDCIFKETGEITRRLGFDLEANHTAWNATVTGRAVREYVWKNVGGLSTINFVVQQIGSTIHFFTITDTGTLSSGKLVSTISLSTYKVSDAPSTYYEQKCHFASGLNYLFVAHPYCSPFYVSYDTDTETLTATKITVRIRDFEGVDDGLDVDERPTTLSKEHEYNLHNQGWYIEEVRYDGSSKANPIELTFEQMGDYPSNAEVWWLYKNAEEEFRPRRRDDFARGNTRAPRGHFILQAFYQDRSDVSDIGSLPVVTSSYYRPSVVSFFAGRVWYAGVEYGKFSNKIYFSQIVEEDNQIGRCYQSNDPTSETSFDLLPTDGGVILIPDIGAIKMMIPIQSSMIVFASNGVWAISGSEGIGFRANDYSVRKISSVGATSSMSFADIEGFAIWWNLDGIYTLSTDNVGSFQVQSLTDQTIKEFYKDIPSVSKEYAKAAYNELDKVVQWIYRSTTPTTVTQKYEYDRVLNFNLLTKAFYPWTISDSTPGVVGIVNIKGGGSTTDEEAVVNSANDPVLAAPSVAVEVTTTTFGTMSSVFKYFVTLGSTMGVAETKNAAYADWPSYGGGVDYTSYFVTGQTIANEGMKFFQTNYVNFYMDEENNASLYVQGRFDFSNLANSGKWGTSQQAYNSSMAGYGTRIRKLKIRGKGRAVQLYCASETGKPFTCIGWGLYITGNNAP